MNIKILLNKLFTVNSLEKVISGQNVTVYKNVINELIEPSSSVSNLQALNIIYDYMSKKHRNEYFYKNTLLNKILLGRHSINTSTAIRELPVNKCILDFLIINGVGQAYEIKTELDNLKRLKDQIENYYHVFSFCNIVTDISHVEQIKNSLDIPEVGIIVLTKRNTLHEERKAIKYEKKLDYESMFKVLRKYEFEAILKDNFGYLPKTKDFEYYDACFQIFKELDVLKAQEEMLWQLKQRRGVDTDNIEKFKMVPREIKSLVYFSSYKKDNFERLDRFLTKKMGDV
ncbi:sce7726 family protein [Bombilactobacillus thymidiniphilus]|uniref:Sce7726 family protein n=1 Tax=Bombilactobacillus thymidiniphilus TaxID=2923363 RepID=A0ABY4PBP6_9LACO|nr:sce7726 family protein [Bombilactobacillus thymidiniphilus]UQS83069.1 sce7726 family protein [Bombilactobacillus thymidiniphilus]